MSEKSEGEENDKIEYNCSIGKLSVCRKDYPKHVLFIIGNEFCERFCYYGMRAILQSYLMLKLGQTADTAASFYHAFAIVAYFTPVFGAIIADSFLGKYWTIVSLSIVYVIGNVIMAATAVDEGFLGGALVGMFTIALGTGGIKPCVSSFGGEQFSERQLDLQKAYFSMFYISINAGSVLSQFITPILKATPCFGQDQCWVLAFGLPAALMIIAVVLFLFGTPFYTKKPVTVNVAVDFSKAVATAVGQSCGKNKIRADHWLDRAVPRFSQLFIDDCKAVFRVLLLFLPLPFFWALFDQQGSRWTYQAQKMDSYIYFLDLHLQPEQVQILNGIMIVVFTGVFEAFVYPLFAKCNLLIRPLQRMVVGCVLAALSFVVIAIIQIGVDDVNDVIKFGDTPTYRTRLINTNADCAFDFYHGTDHKLASLGPYDTFKIPTAVQDTTTFTFKNITCRNNASVLFNATAKVDSPLSYIFFDRGVVSMTYGEHAFPQNEDTGEFQKEYLFQILVSSYTALGSSVIEKMYLVRGDADQGAGFEPQPANPVAVLNFTELRVPSKFYRLNYVTANEPNAVKTSLDLFLQQGGAYFIYLRPNPAAGDNNSSYIVELEIEKKPNGVSVYWQAFPYFIITCGEILFSISGLAFAFSQAPASMKSILTAGWLLTNSLGNVIDLIIIEIQIPDKAVEFFVFASLMFTVTIIFAVLAYFYKYVEDSEAEKTNKRLVGGGQAGSSTQNNSQLQSKYGSIANLPPSDGIYYNVSLDDRADLISV